MIRHVSIVHDKTNPMLRKVKLGKIRRGKTGLVLARLSKARQGQAGLGWARQGEARLGQVRRGEAR